MKNLSKKLSAIALCVAFSSMQAMAALDTGLGAGNGGAVINSATGGYAGTDLGTNSATLNFTGDSHVNWDTLNVNKGETLNFNAINGASGLTVINTVNRGMSHVYGQINSNSGISRLIISNPNGMLFDGAKFTTVGDLMLTTQALNANYDVNGKIDITGVNQEALNAVTIKNSNFSIGGEFNIVAPTIEAVKSAVKAEKGFRLVTVDGQNYLVAPTTNANQTHQAVRLETVSIDGDVYIATAKDIVTLVNGGEIKGDLNIVSDGNVALNYVNNGKKLNVTGDVNVQNDARTSYLRNAKVGGNVKMSNSGGFLEIKDVTVDGDVDLKTTVKTNPGVKHFVHVVGNNDIKGNLKVDSIHNIHIGGYDDGLNALQNGSLKVGGNIDATAREGSIAVTVDTSADKVSLTSGTLNIISNGKATITANEYQFKANHYIGGVDSEDEIMNVMENYLPLPTKGHTYLNIAGGDVTKIETSKNGFALVEAKGDMNVTGIDAGKVKLSSDQHDIVIGSGNKADLIQVDGKTRRLKVELPSNSREYVLKYTDIKDTEVITIAPETEITYEMANGEEGWNKGTQTADNTYLIVPGSPTDPDVPNPPGPDDPDIPNPPGPGPDPDEPVIPTPNPNPGPNPTPQPSELLLQDQIPSFNADSPVAYTPIAFAADLDEEIETGVRKNVDGSVTVVRPFKPVD